MKSISCFMCLVLFCTIAYGQEQRKKRLPCLSLGLQYIQATGNVAKNNSWGFGAKAALSQKTSSSFTIYIAASYSTILGKSSLLSEDTGERKVREESISPFVVLAGTNYQLNKLFFCGLAAGYGFNQNGFRLTKQSSFAYAGNIGLLVPAFDNRLSADVSYNSLPAVRISYIQAGLHFKL